MVCYVIEDLTSRVFGIKLVSENLPLPHNLIQGFILGSVYIYFGFHFCKLKELLRRIEHGAQNPPDEVLQDDELDEGLLLNDEDFGEDFFPNVAAAA